MAWWYPVIGMPWEHLHWWMRRIPRAMCRWRIRIHRKVNLIKCNYNRFKDIHYIYIFQLLFDLVFFPEPENSSKQASRFPCKKKLRFKGFDMSQLTGQGAEHDFNPGMCSSATKTPRWKEMVRIKTSTDFSECKFCWIFLQNVWRRYKCWCIHSRSEWEIIVSEQRMVKQMVPNYWFRNVAHHPLAICKTRCSLSCWKCLRKLLHAWCQHLTKQNCTKMIKNVGLEHGIFGDRWVQIDHFMQVSTIRAHSMTLKFMVRSIFFRTNKELCFPNWRNHAIGFRIFFFAPPGFSTVADCKGPPRTPAGCLPAKKKKCGGAFFKNNAQITCWSKFVIATHKDIAPDDVMLHDSLCNIKPIGTFVPHAVYQWMSATASNRPATREEVVNVNIKRMLLLPNPQEIDFWSYVLLFRARFEFNLSISIKKSMSSPIRNRYHTFLNGLTASSHFLRSLNQAFGTPQPKYRDPSR